MRIERRHNGPFLLGCALVSATTLVVTADDRAYSPWVTPVILGGSVNTSSADFQPFISRDGLSLYFSSDRSGGFGGWDIWISNRLANDQPWDPPANAGGGVNTAFDDGAPTISIDGHRMYFQSNRPDGDGGGDLYVARRHNQRDDLGWRAAEHLTGAVNSPFNEAAPTVFEDETTGIISLYFSSDRPGGPGPGPSAGGVNGQQGSDLYVSTLQPDETFGPPALIAELNSPFIERRPLIRRDGLELFLTSNRPGGFGSMDVWVSTRGATTEPWSAPMNLGPLINGAGPDAGAAISFDATTLYFQSVRPWPSTALYDLWTTTRAKLR